jgi:putative SOS response-associated peptidase YedK
MFTRYSLTAAAETVASRFSVEVPKAFQPMFNAAPTHLLPVITNDSTGGLSFFYWGAPPAWANKKPLGEKIINARIETLEEKPILRKKLREHRCLIPADGFFAWKRTGKKTSIPYRFVTQDKGLFAMAGLWEEYEDEASEVHHTFSIITRPSDDQVDMVTDHMPVLLDPQAEKEWLMRADEDFLMGQLKSFHPVLEHYSVSALVNQPERNSRLIIMPAPAADQFGNLSLFD